MTESDHKTRGGWVGLSPISFAAMMRNGVLVHDDRQHCEMLRR